MKPNTHGDAKINFVCWWLRHERRFFFNEPAAWSQSHNNKKCSKVEYDEEGSRQKNCARFTCRTHIHYLSVQQQKHNVMWIARWNSKWNLTCMYRGVVCSELKLLMDGFYATWHDLNVRLGLKLSTKACGELHKICV